MKKYNILFTYITPFHPERGGIGRVTDSLAREFIKRGHQVWYLIYDSAITTKYEYDYPAPLQYFPSKELMAKENLEFYHQFLQEHHIDVVINQSGLFSDSELYLNTGNYFTKVISVLHNKPWLFYHHILREAIPLRDTTFKEHLKRIARIVLYPRTKRRFKRDRINQMKMLLPQTDLVCTLTEKFFKDLDEIYPGYSDKYIAIPNPNSYSQEQLNGIALEEKKNQAVFIGMYRSEKKIDYMLRIWNNVVKMHPDWELLIFGDGTERMRRKVKQWASKVDNVRLMGFENPLPYQKSAKIVCMTSTYEGWGMTLTEAMQCGCVPIAFNSFESAEDVIKDEDTGFLIKPFDCKEYAYKLAELMDDEELRINMAQKAMSDVKRFDVEKVADIWQQTFDALCDSKELSIS